MSRGRKPGSISGKRPIFWVCVAKNLENLIVDKIYSPNSSEEDIKNFTQEKASLIFERLHGMKPVEFIGPCYDVKSFNKNEKITNSSTSENFINKTNLSAVLGMGQYNGWNGTVFSIEGKTDEVLFIASEKIDVNSNKILPPATPLKKNLINFIEI